MSDPFVGEIRMFAGTFAPAGWAFCAGQLMPISENDVLFNLIGTTYGGDGQETFGLPDLQGRVPVHMGQGPGISQNYIIGQKFGVESVTVSIPQLPQHTHPMIASTDTADQVTGANGVVAATPQLSMYFTSQTDSALNNNTLTPMGGSQPHDNMMPYLCISYIISLFGIYPSPT
jgi:microcystin-dependent protein